MERDKLFPRNCPVMERDGDGRSVGRCWFYLPPPQHDTCPRHGTLTLAPVAPPRTGGKESP